MAKRLSPISTIPQSVVDPTERKISRGEIIGVPSFPESTFRGFIENLPVMFYAIAPEPPYKPIYISPAFERFGYPIQELLTEKGIWARIIHDDDRDQILKDTKAAMFKGNKVDYEYRIVARDGTIFWVRDRGCFIKDEKRQLIGWQGVIIDVTDRKHSEVALRESEERYRQLFENANDLIYVHDLEGNFISINKAAKSIFGYTHNEALSTNLDEIVVPEHLDRIKQKSTSKMAGDTDQTVYEVDCTTKAGSRITIEVNSSLISKDGRPLAIQGIARDITERKMAEDLRRKSEERYRELFENAHDLIYTHDMTGKFTSLNRAGELITGYSRDEAFTRNISDVVAPEFLDGARTMTAKKLAGEKPSTYEIEIIAKDGHRVTLELSTRLIVQNGLPIGVQGIGRDITERRRTENSLHDTLSLFASTFESTADGIVVMSLERQVITCNKKFMEMWNVTDEIIENVHETVLIQHIYDQAENSDEFAETSRKLYDDPMSTATETIRLKNGRIYERYSQPQFKEGVPVGRVSSFRDITERIQAEEKLRRFALQDPLTNLPNRVEFMNHLRTATERAENNEFAKFAVLFLDLDRFKVINDSLGHATGDKLLIAIAERLKSCVRPGDVVARLGGDEFVILLNRSGGEREIVGVADRLQKRISEPFKIDNYEVFTTASIGIIISGKTKRTPEDFLRDADAAMYRAKESGKARYEIFDREMHVRNMNLLQVEMDLRHAVERDEFEIVYQPIVDLITGSVQEFEALIRWRHPEHGLVEPNEFISVAEETGLIIPIGKWILDESCRQIANWQPRFSFPLSISVNLSAKQLMHPTLTTQVKNILSETGLDPSQLKLEVTESTVMEYSEKALNVLMELDEMGISLSTDDFGTGYSSLSYLQRFPFERLKIDRSFIKIMEGDKKSTAIVKTILMLGENLNIDVVAEGIETAEQLTTLRQLGCRTGQGYLFSRPIDADAAERFLIDGADIFRQDRDLVFSPEDLIHASNVQ